MTNDQLLDLIANRNKFVPDAINAAVAMLQNRGHVFDVDELDNIQEDVSLKMEMQKETTEYSYSDDMSIFPDNQIPVYYSKRAIICFSVFVTTLFGAVLLAINLKGSKRNATIVVVFGIAYSCLSFYILDLMPPSSILTLLVNGIGGAILTGLFWRQYIGINTKYTNRSIRTPLIIAVGIILLAFLLLAVVSDWILY